MIRQETAVTVICRRERFELTTRRAAVAVLWSDVDSDSEEDSDEDSDDDSDFDAPTEPMLNTDGPIGFVDAQDTTPDLVRRLPSVA